MSHENEIWHSIQLMGRCRPRVSASRSGGENTAASYSGDSLDLGGGERDKVSG